MRVLPVERGLQYEMHLVEGHRRVNLKLAPDGRFAVEQGCGKTDGYLRGNHLTSLAE